MDICLRVLKKSKNSRFDVYCVRKSVLIISYVTFRDCHVQIFPTTFLNIAVYKETLAANSPIDHVTCHMSH